MSFFARREITQKGFGAMVAANEWLPIFKACMMAIIIGLIPLVAVFVASNVGGRALSFLVGSFIFMAAWGVTDAIVTAASAPYIVDMFNSIRDTGLGLETFVNFPDYSTKAASVYGSLRSSAVAFAGMISFALMRFGGHALAQVGGGITGQVQGAGASAGQAASPEGAARIMESMVNSGATFATAGAYSPQQWTAAKAFQNATSMENHSAAMDAAGQLGQPTDTPSLASSMARANIPGMMVGNQAISTKVNSGGGIAFGSIGGYAPDTGFLSNDTFGGGSTSINRTGPAGNVKGVRHADGTMTYNQATANNVDSKAIQGEGERFFREGSNTLSGNNNWSKATTEANKLAQTSNAAKEFKSQLENSHQHGLVNGIMSSTGISQDAKNELIKSMGGTVRADGGVSWDNKTGPTGSVSIGADGDIRVRASNGSSSTIKLSDEEKDSLQQIERGARSEAWAQTLGNSATRDVATQVGHAIGAGQAVSQVTKGMSMQTLDSRQSADMQTAYHVDQAKQQFGTNNPTPEQVEAMVAKTSADVAGGGAGARARMAEMAAFSGEQLQGHPTRTAAQEMINQAGDRASGAYGQFQDNHGAPLAEAGRQASQAGAAAQSGQPMALPEAPASMVPPPVPGEELPSNMDPPPGSVPLDNTHSGNAPPSLPAIPPGAMTPVNYDQRKEVMDDKQEKMDQAAKEHQDYGLLDRAYDWARDLVPIPREDSLMKDGQVNFNHLPSVSTDPQNLSATPTNPLGNPEETKDSPYVGAPMNTTGADYSRQQPDINDFLFENAQYGGKGEGKKP
ncbi:MAG: conjugal transfer protein TraG N-terminal domain-containing protein [Trichloromonas sp.]|jgi:hypothetical protein|nr:conjugal transfer protein TraG N-terminal domain-containing protein [Trichloromonas sp.]